MDPKFLVGWLSVVITMRYLVIKAVHLGDGEYRVLYCMEYTYVVNTCLIFYIGY